MISRAEQEWPDRHELTETTLDEYIADYVNEELARGHAITSTTIHDAMEAYEGGAR